MNLRLFGWRRMGLVAAALALPEAFLAVSFAGDPAGDPAIESAAAPPAALVGRWRAEAIRRRGVIGHVETMIAIAADGKVTGSGGCNRISGGATVSAARIRFGPMISTEMACAPEVMDQEREFLAALGAARLWRIDEQRDKLILVDAHGVTVLRLLRM